MKRLLAVTLAMLMVLALAACTAVDAGNGANGTTANPAGNNSGNTGNNSGDTGNSNGNGGSDDFDSSRRIAVFTREDGSGTRDAFASITGVGDDMYDEAIVLTSTGEIRTNIADNPYGIGYISLGSMNDTVKALSIGGVAPSNDSILDGSYAIQRPFLLVTNDDKDTNELVQDFLSFALSSQGQELLGTSWISAGNTGDYTTSGLSGTLKIGGSTSVDPLMQLMRTAYIELNPAVEIEISGGGSGTGISEATDGTIDIGMSSRKLRDTETLNEYTIALDGVAVIVSLENPLGNLDIDTVKAIFTGEATSWSEVIG